MNGISWYSCHNLDVLLGNMIWELWSEEGQAILDNA